ncbi:MAG: hypothetical protein WC673_02390 [Candidatus Paceibacterota bacterium]|jgi:energy-coupling factor transporter transmembrane protein EcfT
MKIFAYLIVFLISLVLYFNASSVITYALFVIVTFCLFYYNLKLVSKFRQSEIWKKVLLIIGVLISILIVFVFYFVAHGFQNLCTQGPDIYAKNYFTGEVKNFYCGITPWYYQKLQGQEEQDARSKAKVVESQTCKENLANNPLYQKIKSGTATFDNLTGNFAQGAQSIYLLPVAENTFGIIGGINYGFDFSTGKRTSDLSNADIVVENGKIKSMSGKSIYLDNTLDSRTLLQEFHQNDTVFSTQPVETVDLKDFSFAFIKTRENNFAKVQNSTQSTDNRGNTEITFFWAYQPNGTKSLKSNYAEFVTGLENYCIKMI